MAKSKVTLTKIAQHAGVSITSVSRVVHSPHLTSRHTQERVNQSIEALGFNASILKPYSPLSLSKKILIIDNQLITDSLINKGIESKAKVLGYKLLYLRFFYFSEQEIQQIISYTIDYHVDGILIINDAPYLRILQQYQHALPPIVFVNHFSLAFSCVYFDHLSNAYQATKYLIDQGHKRIAILLGDIEKEETRYLKKGYEQALTRANIMISQDYISHHCFNYSTSYKTVKKLMALAFPPTAIICSDHINLSYVDREKFLFDDKFDQGISAESAICGVIDQCLAMNIDIPAHLSLLQFIHHKGHKQYRPLNHICSMYRPLFDMGEKAIMQLISLFTCPYRERRSSIIDVELVTRHSTSSNNKI
ncbi:LacI family DNA-binding transcriptional regulator [Orbus sturtevantii]|uniref:LacI family DNA-binding transcriptional regulator n=1 Tax=Orbus sturtevantii TaxID=3074109 RepID=UPI00370DD419